MTTDIDFEACASCGHDHSDHFFDEEGRPAAARGEYNRRVWCDVEFPLRHGPDRGCGCSGWSTVRESRP